MVNSLYLMSSQNHFRKLSGKMIDYLQFYKEKFLHEFIDQIKDINHIMIQFPLITQINSTCFHWKPISFS